MEFNDIKMKSENHFKKWYNKDDYIEIRKDSDEIFRT